MKKANASILIRSMCTGSLAVISSLILLGCQQGRNSNNPANLLPGPIITADQSTMQPGGSGVGTSPSVPSPFPIPTIAPPVGAPSIPSVPMPGAAPPIQGEIPVSPFPTPTPVPGLRITLLPGRDRVNAEIPVGTGTGLGSGLISGTANVNIIAATVTGGLNPLTLDVQIDPTPTPPNNSITNINGTFTASFSADLINNQVFINAAFIFPGTYDLQIAVTDAAGQTEVANITIVITQAAS